jgi:hypothetical protein
MKAMNAQPAKVTASSGLEFLGVEKRGEQIDADDCGDRAAEDEIEHGVVSGPRRPAGIEREGREPGGGDAKINQIVHGASEHPRCGGTRRTRRSGHKDTMGKPGKTHKGGVKARHWKR